jgi:hypothetical protein
MTSSNVCSNESFPFNFFAANGTQVSGILSSDGQCVFPEANCNLNASVTSCCQAKSEFAVTGSNYMFIAFSFIFLPYFFVRYGGGNDEGQQERREARIPAWVKNVPLRSFRRLFAFGLPVYIIAQVMIPIFMRNSIQSKMSVGSRNSLIAAEAFLVPYSAIFQFIEDIVLVKVNYALGSGNKERTDQLVHAGIAGSFGTGLFASVLATILGVIPPVLQALTNPGLQNDEKLYPGCEFIAKNNLGVLPYWLFEVWAMPGTQIGLVMSGFMMGALELETIGWIGGVSLAMIPIIWFSRVLSTMNPLLLLASAEFTAAWTLPVLATAYIVSPLGEDLRRHTGVNLEVGKLFKNIALLLRDTNPGTPSNDEDMKMESGEECQTDDKNEDLQNEMEETMVERPQNGLEEAMMEIPPRPGLLPAEEEENTKTLLAEGIKIMVMDVAIQACISLSIYLALSKDAAVGYQLTALQAALPTYGIAYALGMGITFKIVGPQLLARKMFREFSIIGRLTVLCGYLLVPLIIGAVVPFRRGMAFSYGENACAYAKNSQCVPFFTKVFGPNVAGGPYTLPFTFDVFSVGAAIEAVFFVLRASLLACMDLDYMLWSTAGAVIVYVPAIIVATVVPPFGSQAAAFFVAMYVPQFVLICLFTVRIELLIRKMLGGERGTWGSKASIRRSTRFSSGA